MDESIWIFIGIVSAIIGIGVIANVITRAGSERNDQELQTAVQMLGVQCEQVCGLAENTALSVNIELPADTVIITNDDRICGEFTSGKDAFVTSCVRCACKHDDALIINTSGAGAFYKTHVFSCRYTHVDTLNTQYKAMVNCSG